MKKLPKSSYYGPLCIVFLVGFYYLFYFSTIKKHPFLPSDYKLFHVIATDDAWESTGKNSAVCFNYELLDDVSQYKQQFFFQNSFYDTKATSPRSIKKNIRKNDSLIIGVLQSDINEVQSYSENFIKNDFFNRELKVYWIKKKEKVLRSPKNCLEEEMDHKEEWLFIFSLILLGSIARIIYLTTKKVKFFT